MRCFFRTLELLLASTPLYISEMHEYLFAVDILRLVQLQIALL